MPLTNRIDAGTSGRPLAPAAEPTGPVGRLVDGLLDDAIARRASDLHLDPAAGGTRARLRVDGMFEEGPAIPSGLHERIVARVKVLSGLTVYVRDAVQEGSIRRPGGIDLRVSVLPTVAGEKVTLRIFDPAVRPLRLEDLGFEDGVAGALGRFADLRQGALVVAGPAGSGKTTTLYALLHRILERRAGWTNACSVEDPVELAIPGVHQVAVDRGRGLTFARGLSALLRQDPEVILVGEIRDRETAEIAIEAGMTGHLVLTSVHAGRAAEALSRLGELGVEPSSAAASLRGVVAQRLLRGVCPHCATETDADPALLERFRLPAGEGWRRGRGCGSCRGTGYAGRFPVAEVLPVARGGASTAGGTTLAEAALAAARAGRTTLEEVARLIDPDGDAR